MQIKNWISAVSYTHLDVYKRQVNYSESDEVFLGKDFSTRKNYSEGIATEIDHEVKSIIEEAYEVTSRILTDNMDKLERVAQALLEVETLDGEQFEALYTGEVDAQGLAELVKMCIRDSSYSLYRH